MCLVLLEYYPRREWMEQRCMTQLDRTKTPLAMGAKDCANTEDQDEMWIIDDKGKDADVILATAMQSSAM